jgi:hypothetical protein
MNLDINSDKGQVSLSYEKRLLESVKAFWPQFSIVETPKDQPSDVDGFLIKNGVVYAVFETKARTTTLNQLKEWNNEWLVTYDKVVNGAKLARQLRVPFIGFVYLINEPIGVSIKIADKFGCFLQKTRLEKTKTQATINGGEAFRVNAFISLENCTTFPILK